MHGFGAGHAWPWRNGTPICGHSAPSDELVRRHAPPPGTVHQRHSGCALWHWPHEPSACAHSVSIASGDSVEPGTGVGGAVAGGVGETAGVGGGDGCGPDGVGAGDGCGPEGVGDGVGLGEGGGVGFELIGAGVGGDVGVGLIGAGVGGDVAALGVGFGVGFALIGAGVGGLEPLGTGVGCTTTGGVGGEVAAGVGCTGGGVGGGVMGAGVGHEAVKN